MEERWNSTLPIYEANGAPMVRLVTWFLFAVMVASLFAAQGIYQHMIAGDGSYELASHRDRIVWALIVGGVGVAMFVPMLFYLRVYAVRLLLLPDERRLRVTTLRLFGTHDRDVPFDALAQAGYHRGRWESIWTPSVNAPYYWVRVRGGNSFLLDLNGEFRNRAGLDGLLGLGAAVDAVDADEGAAEPR